MYFKRHIDEALIEWKNDPYRKPLLMRGARQVGKSSAIRNLGKSFRYFLELNLERDRSLATLFGDNLDVKKICAQLAAIKGVPVIAGETLLFIDEIQESERAISALRYFYEEIPELHVVAAGSLLEFTLNNLPSFGVGRVSSMYMYPCSFMEFLSATGDEGLGNYMTEFGGFNTPLPEPMHNALVERLRSFYLIGGMPEAVKIWIETGDYIRCQNVHNDILSTYRDDFAKYSTRISPLVLRSTLLSVARQSGSKFVYSRVEGDFSTPSVKEALQLLSLSGLAIPVVHTAANGVPLGAEINLKYCKYLLLDIGLMQTLLDMPPEQILLSGENDFVNKGAMSEVFAGLELLKYNTPRKSPQLYYWQRASSEGQAEIDYVVEQRNGVILPLEIKSGVRGSMQSLRLFMSMKHIDFGVRISMENFGIIDNIGICPLYAISSLKQS